MTNPPTPAAILSARLGRQRLTAPIGRRSGFVGLFKALQPVSPVYFSCPGDPPRMVHRTTFDDGLVSDGLRRTRTIVKGRFLGGAIGYVLAEDLPECANTFRKPLARLTATQEIVWDAVRTAGPLTPRQIKEETGLLNKQIMPALHRLQRAFLVYEDQTDSDWERAWYDFSAEWPEVELDDRLFEQSAICVLGRFFDAHVFATFEQVKYWSQLPSRALAELIEALADAGRIIPAKVASLGEGWLAQQPRLPANLPHAPTVFMLHKADFLVRSHASELKRRFGNDEVLQYLLIDGEFHGAVLGHWRIGPHDVSDIALTLPTAGRQARRDAILQAVGRQYHPPRSRILRYDGKKH